MNKKFSDTVKEIIQKSGEVAKNLGHAYIGSDHLALAMLNLSACLPTVHLSQMTNLKELRERITSGIPRYSPFPPAENLFVGEFPVTTQLQRVLKTTFLEAKMLNIDEVSPEVLMLAMLKTGDSHSTGIFNNIGLDYQSFKNKVSNTMKETLGSNPDPSEKKPSVVTQNFEQVQGSDEDDDVVRSRIQKASSQSKSRTPVLDNFSKDITKLADEGKIDPKIGRDLEIEKIVHIISGRQTSSAILVGESGVGKTSVIERLALNIMQRKIGRTFFNRRIVALDLDAINEDDPKKAEERIKAVIIELGKSRDIILVIEQIETVLLPDSPYNVVIAKFLRKSLSASEFPCIATTDPISFKNLKRDKAFDKAFQPVEIAEPSSGDTLYILKNIRPKFEEFHNVTYTDDALKSCVELSSLYIQDKFLPEKSIQIMDQVGALVHLKNIHVPKHIELLEKGIEEIKELKNRAVKEQRYEDGADLRDKESKMVRQLEFAKMDWEEEAKLKRYPVEEVDVEYYCKQTFKPVADATDKRDSNQGESEQTQYFREKIEEFDLNNKSSFKIKDVPPNLKTCFQQYLLFFRDYLEKVKGKSISFEVTKISEGLRIDLDPTEIEDFEQLDTWFNEYLDFIRGKSENIEIVFEKDVSKKESERIFEEVKNQVDFLEKQINLIQPQLKLLSANKNLIDTFTLEVTDKQKCLIELGYSDFDIFKFTIKQKLGASNLKDVFSDLLAFFKKFPEDYADIIDELLLLNSKISNMEFKVNAGMISYDVESMERQKVSKAMIDLINRISI